MAEDIQAEIKEISYGGLLFRHIDRILNLSNRDFVNDETKLFTFSWSVKLLRSSIPDEIITKQFLKEEQEIEYKTRGSYKERFEAIQQLFTLCINLLASKGYLYRKVTDGDYDEVA